MAGFWRRRRERGGRFCWCGCRWSRFEDLSEDGSARESSLEVVDGQEEILSRLGESINGQQLRDKSEFVVGEDKSERQQRAKVWIAVCREQKG